MKTRESLGWRQRREAGFDAVADRAVMNQCTTFHIPSPASIFVAQTGASTYGSFHYQGATNCSGPRQAEGSFAVGSCSGDLGGSSEMRDSVLHPWRYVLPVLRITQ